MKTRSAFRSGRDCEYRRGMIARLEYTCVQRGTTSRMLRDDSRSALSCFSYVICGVPTGLHEGILLGQTDNLSLPWLHRIADDTEATLFKLTRSALPPPGPTPVATGTVQAYKRELNVYRRDITSVVR